MDKHVVYQATGVCTHQIEFDFVDGFVHNVKMTGGCRGNTTGLARLAEGMRAEKLVYLLEDVECRGSYSCPSQLAAAVKACLET